MSFKLVLNVIITIMITMTSVINQHVAKIALALKEGDSISRISKKIGSSYGWTYKWVKKLEELGVLNRKKEGIEITDRDLIREFRSLAKSVLQREMKLEDAYLLPNFSGMRYAFTKTDAVFIWTKGGYQIGRSKGNYPIFVKVLEEDLERWKNFFKDFSADYSVEKRTGEGIYFVLFPERDFKSEWVDNSSVIPLEETVEWARKYEYNFQPGLEMLDELYDLGLGIEYRERAAV